MKREWRKRRKRRWRWEKKEGYFKTRSALHQALVKPNAVKFRETTGFPLNKRKITSSIKCIYYKLRKQGRRLDTESTGNVTGIGRLFKIKINKKINKIISEYMKMRGFFK